MRAFASITASLVAVAAAFTAPPAVPARAPTATRAAVLRMFELPSEPTKPEDLVITSITRSQNAGSGRVRSRALD